MGVCVCVLWMWERDFFVIFWFVFVRSDFIEEFPPDFRINMSIAFIIANYCDSMYVFMYGLCLVSTCNCNNVPFIIFWPSLRTLYSFYLNVSKLIGRHTGVFEIRWFARNSYELLIKSFIKIFLCSQLFILFKVFCIRICALDICFAQNFQVHSNQWQQQKKNTEFKINTFLVQRISQMCDEYAYACKWHIP